MAVGVVFSIVRLIIPEDDAVTCAQVNAMGIDNGKILIALAVSVKPAHAVQKLSVNWGEPICSVPSVRERYVK